MTNRREFLKRSALAAAGLAAAGKAGSAFERILTSPLSAADKSKVVLVRSKAVVDASGKIANALLERMLERAMTAYTGHSSAADSWRKFFSPEDVVGLKINTLGCMDVKGTDATMHFASIIAAIAGGDADAAERQAVSNHRNALERYWQVATGPGGTEGWS